MKKSTTPVDLRAQRREILDSRAAGERLIIISSGTCGQASGSQAVIDRFNEELEKRGLQRSVAVKITGCHGLCECEPDVLIWPEGLYYRNVEPTQVPLIIEETVIGGRAVESLLYKDPATGLPCKQPWDIPFYRKQKRLLTEKNLFLDPEKIDDYLAIDGYEALTKALSRTPEWVIGEVGKAGLRGRGGAGFPTDVKWRMCRSQASGAKYIICNADEGDPGAYMDRNLLEANPHGVIEGMIIGAYAIGACKGVIFVRHEYPLAVRHALNAVEQAREAGLLGNNILGSDFSFDIDVIEGSGAFVSGEETALIASIEGRRGQPTPKPPYPAERGLYGKPTVINNVETWANIPLIILRGWEWFSAIGKPGNRGTKIFSLVGKVNITGLVEVPLGTTLREMVEDIGGGIKGGKKFKAVQTGGPSGGCLPAEKLDLPLDYESLAAAGTIMGSGGMIVMDEETCMVDIALYFLRFTESESCGQCAPCRVGTRRMAEILKSMTSGTATPADLEELETLAQTVKETSLCGLGRSAPNPVLSTLRWFRDEYMAHVIDKRCPARVCRDLIYYWIDPKKCLGCGLCSRACPAGAISKGDGGKFEIDPAACKSCGACSSACPGKAKAISKRDRFPKDTGI